MASKQLRDLLLLFLLSFPVCFFSFSYSLSFFRLQTSKTNSFNQKIPDFDKNNTRLLAGCCRTLKFVETFRNLETNSLSENTSPAFPAFFHGLTEQVTSRSAKCRERDMVRPGVRGRKYRQNFGVVRQSFRSTEVVS